MCGFAGFVDFQGSRPLPPDRLTILRAMGRQLGRRGPDEERFHDEEHLSLVFRRLSIVDIAHGHQPIWNEDNSILVAVNGEIYNHLEIRRGLEGRHQFRTGSDAEAILHLYEEEGLHALQELNGMYAILLWDKREKRIILARDRLGIKPLFYSRAGSQLIFGSELKGLIVHPDCPNQFDWSDHGDLLTSFYGGLNTYVRGVETLPGGHFLVHSPAGTSPNRRYWNLETILETDRSDFRLSRQGCVDHYAELISDSVRLQLMGEAGIGIFLSGGLDSSLIVALAAANGAPIHAYSLLEKSIFATGDNHRARSVAKRFNAEHHSVLIDSLELLRRLKFSLETFEYLIWMMELPFFAPEFLWKHELHRYAKTHLPDLKVILIGQGADEFCGGYSRQYAAWTGPNDAASAWNRYLNSERLLHNKSTLQRQRICETWHPLIAASYIDQLALSGGGSFDRSASLETKSPYKSVALRNLVRLQNYNLWHEDRTSASQGVESRVPFLDHRLVEFLLGIPDDLHADLFLDKRIEREVAARWLGTGALQQPKVGLARSNDMSSVECLQHHLILSIFPAFDESYLAAKDALFAREPVHRLFERSKQQHGTGRAASTLLLLMATAVFEKMLRTRAGQAPLQCLLPPSPLISLDDFSMETWTTVLAPSSPDWWAPHKTAALSSEIQLAMGLSAGVRPKEVVVILEDEVQQRLDIPLERPWIYDLLLSLASATTPLTVENLAASLNLPQPTLVEALVELFRLGIVVSD